MRSSGTVVCGSATTDWTGGTSSIGPTSAATSKQSTRYDHPHRLFLYMNDSTRSSVRFASSWVILFSPSLSTNSLIRCSNSSGGLLMPMPRHHTRSMLWNSSAFMNSPPSDIPNNYYSGSHCGHMAYLKWPQMGGNSKLGRQTANLANPSRAAYLR